MPGKPKKPLTKSSLVRLIALLEETLAEIDDEHEAASVYHQSELVESARVNAGQALTEAVRQLAMEHFHKAERHCAVSWFYLNFARGILDAEFTEHQLGEDVFLDLVPTHSAVRDEVTALMLELKTELNAIYASLEPLPEGSS